MSVTFWGKTFFFIYCIVFNLNIIIFTPIKIFPHRTISINFWCNVLRPDWNLHLKNSLILHLQADQCQQDLNGFIQITKRTSLAVTFLFIPIFVSSFSPPPFHWLQHFLSTSDSDYQLHTTPRLPLGFSRSYIQSHFYLFLNKFYKFTKTTSSYTENSVHCPLSHSFFYNRNPDPFWISFLHESHIFCDNIFLWSIDFY